MTQTNKTTLFPPGITTHTRPTPFGMIFAFEHADLGIVGRLWLVSRGQAQTGIAVEAEGDPDDPLSEERFSLFHAIVRACFEATGGLGPAPQLENVRASARLYQRFRQIEHSRAMWTFARGLTEQDYRYILTMATCAAQIAAPADAPLREWQLTFLQLYRQASPEARPGPRSGISVTDGRQIVKRRRAPGKARGKRPQGRRCK
jgi:hypothetical protein